MLSAAERNAYATDGFLLVPNLLAPAEVEALKREWTRLWQIVEATHPNVQARGHVSSGHTPDRIDPAYPLSPVLKRLTADIRLTGLAAEVLGAPAALFKDKLISKLPGTHGYGLHQDWPYWERYGVPANEMTSVMIALDHADAENGALEIWPRQLSRLPADPNNPLDADPAALPRATGEIIRMAPGDCLLFHPLVPHRSATNRSGEPRRSYFITYVTKAHEAAAARYTGVDP